MNNIAHERLTGFPRALREAGLAIDPSRAGNFLAAIARIDLHSFDDLRRAGRVTLTSSPADIPVFDAVFASWFGMETSVAADAELMRDEETRRPSQSHLSSAVEYLTGETSGQDASLHEVLSKKTFSDAARNEVAILDAISKLSLPSIETRQWRHAHLGTRIDLARTAASARKTFGETFKLDRLARPSSPRKILLLIDVSGSMKVHSEAYLRASHALTRSSARVETFCFSTRLTRATDALRHRNADEALRRLSEVVSGFDGGTRIGDSLQEFLAVSRYASLVRGAITIVLSDGLECGDTGAVTAAVERLSRLSHRLVWLTPLACDPRYMPVTRAMSAILPNLDRLADASDLASLHRALCDLVHIEREPRSQAARAWRKHRKNT